MEREYSFVIRVSVYVFLRVKIVLKFLKNLDKNLVEILEFWGENFYFYNV